MGRINHFKELEKHLRENREMGKTRHMLDRSVRELWEWSSSEGKY